MSILDAIVLPSAAPHQIIGLELYLLDAAADRRIAPTLVVFGSPGKFVSLGRYHFYDAPAESSGSVAVSRRLTGGRIVGAGQGWVSIALVLASRTALLAERDAHIAPEQLMNRHIRGLLAALRSLGCDCFYPGRDAVTARGRELAMCSLEITSRGAMLFEASLAVNRGMEDLIHELDRFDPGGALTSPMYDASNATKLVRELDRDVGFDDLVAAICAGYGEFAGGLNARKLTAEEQAQAARRSAILEADGWPISPRPPAIFNRRNRTSGQIGTVDAQVLVNEEFNIARLRLGGDLIANSSGLAELEAALKGAHFDFASISRAINETYGRSENFILGLDLSNLARLVAGAT